MSARAAELSAGSSGRALTGWGPGPGHQSPDTGPCTGLLTSQPTVFTVSNESPLAPKLTTLSLLTMKWEKLGIRLFEKNWCNGDIFWCWPSHMENELKATNKSYFSPRMLSCQGKKLIKSLDNHETSCRRFLSWNKIRPFEGHNNRFLCHQIKCFCFFLWGKAVANCILNRF